LSEYRENQEGYAELMRTNETLKEKEEQTVAQYITKISELESEISIYKSGISKIILNEL